MRTTLTAAAAAVALATAGCSLSIDPGSVKPPASGPELALSASTVGFTAVVAGASPAAQSVTVTNAGAGTLAPPTAPVTYVSGTGGWLTATVLGTSAPYSVTLQATLGALPVGTYTARVTVASAGAASSPRTIDVTFEVVSAPPRIQLSTASLGFAATEGGSNPTTQQVTVTNVGGGSLASPTRSITYVSGSSWLTVSPSGPVGGPYVLTVGVTVGTLAPGTYDANVSVASAGAPDAASFTVRFTVGSSSQPTLTLEPTSLAFSATSGGSNPATKLVTVANAGAGTLAAPTTAVTYDQAQTGWLSVSAPTGSAGGPYVITVGATVGALPAGTYTATVNVTSAGASTPTVPLAVQLTVVAPPNIQVASSLSFTGTEGGSNPTAQNLTVSNTGGGTLASPTANVTYISGNDWLNVGTPTGGAGGPYTIPVQPIVTAVSPGVIYTATLAVTCLGASPEIRNVTVSFRVSALPRMTLAPSSLSFTATQGGDSWNQTVTVSNSGDPTLATPTATVTSGGTWLSIGAASGPTGGPYAFTVSATPGSLAPGFYTGQITFASAGAKLTPLTYAVTFTVNGLVQPVLDVAPGSLTFSARQGGPNPSSQSLSVTNTGTGTLLSPTFVTTTSAGGSWLAVTAPTGTAGGPYAFTVQAALGSLAAGSYAGKVTIASAGATGSPKEILVTLNVNPPGLGGCVLSGTHKVCGGGFSAGGAAGVASSASAIKKSKVQAGGAAAIQSTSHKIARGAVSPGANP
jgi:hypothetical protein